MAATADKTSCQTLRADECVTPRRATGQLAHNYLVFECYFGVRSGKLGGVDPLTCRVAVRRAASLLHFSSSPLFIDASVCARVCALFFFSWHVFVVAISVFSWNELLCSSRFSNLIRCFRCR